MKKLTLILILLATPCFGAPSISGVSGTVSNGESITISGTDFGSHSDHAAGKSYLCAAWDNLEDGTIDTDVFTLGGGGGPERVYQGSSQRTNSEYCARAARYTSSQSWTTLTGGSGSGNYKYNLFHTPTPNPDPQVLFVSGWFMCPTNFRDDLMANDSPSQFKFLSGVSENNNGNTYWSFIVYDAAGSWVNARLNFEDSRSAENPGKVAPSGEMVDEGTWYRYDIAIDTSKALNNKVSYFYIDGEQVCGTYNYTEPTDCGADQGECPRYFLPSWVRYAQLYSGTNTPYLYHDDFYANYTWARVELSENSTWDENNQYHKEIQIPTSWSSTSITVDVNQGSFGNTTAYLYVIDSDGNASSGYQVNLGESKTFSGVTLSGISSQ